MKTHSSLSTTSSLPRSGALSLTGRAGRRWLPLRRALGCVAVALLTSAVATAQSDYFVTLDVIHGELRDMAVGKNGTIIAAGTKYVGEIGSGVVRASGDGGANWTEYPDSEVGSYDIVATGRREILPATATDPATFENSIVIAGINAATGKWKVMRSLDGAATWALIDDFSDPLGTPEICSAAIDSAGNVYIGGAGYELVTVTTRKGTSTQKKMAWVVRRIPRDATLPTTYKIPGSVPYAMTCVEQTLYVAGDAIDPTWKVIRSDDAGKNWTVIDSSNQVGRPFGMAAGSYGSIYVVGQEPRGGGTVKGKTTPSVPYWIARKGTGAAGSFTTIAAISNLNIKGDANDVTLDPSGNVHITGSYADASGTESLLTQRLDALTQQWATTDSVAPGAGWKIESDGAGNIYSADWTWRVRGPQP